MQTFYHMTKRNIKMFFKDKGMFFTSLITPIILLVLFVTFLAKVYRDSFASALPDGFEVSSSILNGMVGGELVSSLLAVSCVTVAFCSNLLMVQDKVSGAKKDLYITPAKKSTLAFSYYFASLITTLIVSYTATGAGFIYLAIQGWFLSFADVLLILLDVFLLTMFGTAISSVINVFLSTNGQASAVGTIVSAGYGFICGAYMPISNFGVVLQNILSFLPGTYGTSLLRNHFLNGVFKQMSKTGFPSDVVEKIKDSVDCNLKFFNTNVSQSAMYLVMIGAIAVFIGLYVLIHVLRKNKNQ